MARYHLRQRKTAFPGGTAAWRGSERGVERAFQSLGLDVVVQDHEGNEVDMRQEFDDEETSFDTRDVGDDVLVESELQDDYSVKDADEGFESDLDEEEEEQDPDAAALENIDELFKNDDVE